MHGQSCTNCCAGLTGPYCAACGQKAGEAHPSLSHLVREFVDDLSHADARIWRTLIPMLIAPGAVVRDYLDGRRARYVPPIRLYFFVSLVFFLVLSVAHVALIQFSMSTIPGGARALGGGTPVVGVNVRAFVPAAAVRASTPAVSQDDLARATADGTPGVRAFFASAADLARDPTRSNSLLATWIPRLLFAVMPLFALWLKLLMPRAPLYDHAIFTLYFHAFAFILTGVAVIGAGVTMGAVPGMVWGALVAAALAAHLLLGLRKVYALSWLRGVVTSLLAVIGYVATFVACILAVIIPLLARTA